MAILKDICRVRFISSIFLYWAQAKIDNHEWIE